MSSAVGRSTVSEEAPLEESVVELPEGAEEEGFPEDTVAGGASEGVTTLSNP